MTKSANVNRTSYSIKQKVAALDLASKNGILPTAKELNIGATTLKRWRKNRKDLELLANTRDVDPINAAYVKVSNMDATNSDNKDDEVLSNYDKDNDEAAPSNKHYNVDESNKASIDDDEGLIISSKNITNDNASSASDNSDDNHDDDEVAIADDAADVIVGNNRKRRRSNTAEKGDKIGIENNNGDSEPNNNDDHHDDDDDNQVARTAFVVTDVGNRNRRSGSQKGDMPKIVIEQIISFIIERSALKSTNTTTTTNNTSNSGINTASRPNTSNTNPATTIDLYVPKRGTLALAAITFNTASQNVSRIWKLAIKNKCNPKVNDYVLTGKRTGHKNGNRKWDREALMTELKLIPYEHRSSLRTMSKALGDIPRTTLLTMLKDGYIRCYTRGDATTANDDNDENDNNCELPVLNEENMLQRIYYCSNRIHKLDYGYDSNNNTKMYYYDDRYNEIHIDHKWFYVKKKRFDHQQTRFYLTEDEPDPPLAPKLPLRNQQQYHEGSYDNDKVMFLLAIARPCFDDDGNCLFDGKIGIWPFIEERHTELDPYVPINDVSTNLYLYYMKYKVIPAIKQYFNNKQNMKIYIQHDNDNYDLKTNIEWIDFCHYEEIQNQWSFIVNDQPSNSHDMNVCQFSFFPKIHLLQRYKKRKHQIRSVNIFIRKVLLAYNNEYHPMLLSKAWYTYNEILNCILNDDGNNEYNNEHISDYSKKQQEDINKGILKLLPPKMVFVNHNAIETLKQFQLL